MHTSPHFSWAKLKNKLKFGNAPMIATLARAKPLTSLEEALKTPPTQTSSSSGNPPQKQRPTYQGPDGEDPLRYTVPLTPAMQPQLLPKCYSSQGSERPLYERN